MCPWDRGKSTFEKPFVAYRLLTRYHSTSTSTSMSMRLRSTKIDCVQSACANQVQPQSLGAVVDIAHALFNNIGGDLAACRSDQTGVAELGLGQKAAVKTDDGFEFVGPLDTHGMGDLHAICTHLSDARV